jgi:hypothetical protein
MFRHAQRTIPGRNLRDSIRESTPLLEKILP